MASRNSELVSDLKDKFKASVEHEVWKSFIKNATTDFEFLEGIQWTSTEISALQERGQPATVENEIKPIIDRIKGQYVSQKTRILFKGRNLGADEQHNDTLTALALHIQQQTGYEFEESDMFDDGQACGMGVIESFITYEPDMTPKINFRAENALNIFPDPNSKRYNWNEDAEYICRAKWVSYNEAKELYPDYKEEINSFINSNPVTNDSQTMEKNHLIDERLKRIRIVEVWYKNWSNRKIAIGNFGVKDVTGFRSKESSELKKLYPDVKFHLQPEVKIKVGILVGDCIVEDKDSPYEHNMFPFIPYFVNRRKNGEPYSTVRLLKDPQMEINKRRSKALHLLNTNQAVFEEGSVKDDYELKQEMAKPDGLLKYRKGFKFEINKNIDLAATQIQLQSESKSSIARISGISDESMARHSEIRSGIGLQRKQLMTNIIMLPMFANLRRTRLIIGKHIFELIKQFYNEEKVFSVLDDMNKAKEYALTMDSIASIKEKIYDVIVEEAPDTTTIQEEQLTYLSEFIKGIGLPPNVGVALLPIFFRLSQLKNKDEIIKMLEALQQIPPEKPKMSLSLAWDKLYPEEKASFAQQMGWEDLAQFEMQMQRPPSQEVGKADPEMELNKAQMDLELKQAEHGMKMDMEREKHEIKVATEIDKHDIKMQHMEHQGMQKASQSQMNHDMKMSQAKDQSELKKMMAMKPQRDSE